MKHVRTKWILLIDLCDFWKRKALSTLNDMEIKLYGGTENPHEKFHQINIDLKSTELLVFCYATILFQ